MRALSESLCVSKVAGGGVLRGQWSECAGRQDVEVIFLQVSSYHGIEAGDDRSEAQGRTDQAVGAAARAARAQTGAAGGCAGVRPNATHAAARSIEYDSGVNAENAGASPGPQHVGVGNVQVIARNGDVEIVFQSQRDCIVQREIKLAVVHESVDTRAISQVWRCKMPWPVRANGIGKMRNGLGVVQHRNRCGLRRILRNRTRGWLLCTGCNRPQNKERNNTPRSTNP